MTSEPNHNVVLEIEDESLGQNVVERLQELGYGISLDRQGDVLGTPTKEYKVTDK